MSNAYRLDQIFALLLRKGNVSVDELARSFHVTPTTIRRDLLVLEERGLIYRTRGAAYLRDEDKTSTGIFQEEKKRIAIAAAAYLGNGMSVALDSGTTVGAMVEFLCADPQITNIQIITHSPQTAIIASQKFDVSIPGGALLPGSDYMVGLEVEEFYKKLNVDVAVLGSTGVYNCSGLTVSYPLQLLAKKNCAECADKRIALLDSSKFIRRGIYVFCDFKEIDTLITVKTDENEAQLERIAKQGVEIVLV